jgi:hypothetical protein
VSAVLVDDQHLSAILRGRSPHLGSSASIYTTGYWYVRLCRAVLGRARDTGSLSAPFARLPVDRQQQALAALLELRDDIGLVSLRALGPRIGQLRVRHSLNILGMEALAAALHLNAKVVLSASSPQLEAALATEGVPADVRGLD